MQDGLFLMQVCGIAPLLAFPQLPVLDAAAGQRPVTVAQPLAHPVQIAQGVADLLVGIAFGLDLRGQFVQQVLTIGGRQRPEVVPSQAAFIAAQVAGENQVGVDGFARGRGMF